MEDSFFAPSKMIRVPPIITPAIALACISVNIVIARPNVLIKRIVYLLKQRGRAGPLLITAKNLVINYGEVSDRVSWTGDHRRISRLILSIKIQRIISGAAESIRITVAAVQRQVGFIRRH